MLIKEHFLGNVCQENFLYVKYWRGQLRLGQDILRRRHWITDCRHFSIRTSLCETQLGLVGTTHSLKGRRITNTLQSKKEPLHSEFSNLYKVHFSCEVFSSRLFYSACLLFCVSSCASQNVFLSKQVDGWNIFAAQFITWAVKIFVYRQFVCLRVINSSRTPYQLWCSVKKLNFMILKHAFPEQHSHS